MARPKRSQGYFIDNQNEFIREYNLRHPDAPLRELNQGGVCNGLTQLYLQHKDRGTVGEYHAMMDEVNQPLTAGGTFSYDQMTDEQIEHWAQICRKVEMLHTGAFGNEGQLNVKHKLGMETSHAVVGMARKMQDLGEQIENIPVGHAILITTQSHIFTVVKSMVPDPTPGAMGFVPEYSFFDSNDPGGERSFNGPTLAAEVAAKGRGDPDPAHRVSRLVFNTLLDLEEHMAAGEATPTQADAAATPAKKITEKPIIYTAAYVPLPGLQRQLNFNVVDYAQNIDTKAAVVGSFYLAKDEQHSWRVYRVNNQHQLVAVDPAGVNGLDDALAPIRGKTLGYLQSHPQLADNIKAAVKDWHDSGYHNSDEIALKTAMNTLTDWINDNEKAIDQQYPLLRNQLNYYLDAYDTGRLNNEVILTSLRDILKEPRARQTPNIQDLRGFYHASAEYLAGKTTFSQNIQAMEATHDKNQERGKGAFLELQPRDINGETASQHSLMNAALKLEDFAAIDDLIARTAQDQGITKKQVLMTEFTNKDFQKSPLLWAAWQGNIHLMEALFTHYEFTPAEKSALLNTPNSAGQTPLYVALRNEKYEMANYLLAQPGVVPRVGGDTVATFLVKQAIKSGDMDTLTSFPGLSKLDLDSPGLDGKTPLMLAVDHYWNEPDNAKGNLLAFLVEKGANPTLAPPGGVSAARYIHDAGSVASEVMTTKVQEARHKFLRSQPIPVLENPGKTVAPLPTQSGRLVTPAAPAPAPERKRDKFARFLHLPGASAEPASTPSAGAAPPRSPRNGR